MAKQKPQTEEVEKVDFITTELQKFNIADATIAEWSGKFMPLKIDGIKDKEGYEKVREARLFIKGRRVEVEKTSKLLKADALTFQRAVNEEEKRIIALLDPIEEHLYHQEANFEAEKQRIKEEKERQEQQRFNQRNSLLLTNGCAFNGDSYSIADLSIMQSDIRYISDEAFDGFLDKVKVEHEKELEAKAEAERLQREETERMQEENRRQAELIDRQNKLNQLGLRFDGEQFAYKDINFHWIEIQTMSGPEFQKQLAGATKRMSEIKEDERQLAEELKQQQEKKEALLLKAHQSVIDANKKHLVEFLKELGFKEDEHGVNNSQLNYFIGFRHLELDNEDEVNSFKEDISKRVKAQSDKVEADKKRHEDEVKQAEKRAKSDLLEKQKQEAERKAEADRKAKARAERLEALKPVKQKLTDFANMVSGIEIPVLNDVEGDEILKQAKGLLEKVSNYINEKTQNL